MYRKTDLYEEAEEEEECGVDKEEEKEEMMNTKITQTS